MCVCACVLVVTVMVAITVVCLVVCSVECTYKVVKDLDVNMIVMLLLYSTDRT